jgi:hypothetical protein
LRIRGRKRMEKGESMGIDYALYIIMCEGVYNNA